MEIVRRVYMETYISKKALSVSPSPTLSLDAKFKQMKKQGIPVVGFIHFLMSTFGGWKAMPFAARMTLLVLWLIALGVGTFFMINFGMSAIPHC